MNSAEMVDVFVCSNCKAEDSSFATTETKNTTICRECGETVPRDIVQMEFHKGMTLTEYAELLNYINKNHSFGCFGGKNIKYVANTLDMRTGTIFLIKLNLGCNEKIFRKVNENRHRNMLDWVKEYLDN